MRARFLAALAALAAASSAQLSDPLGPYNVDLNHITVGGVSAGACFAVQYHVAFSSEISGAAVLAGAPYYCAQNNLVDALAECMVPIIPVQASTLAGYTLQFAEQGIIDHPSNLADDKVFVFSGKLDTVVARSIMEVVVDYYNLFLNTSSGGNLTTEFNIEAEHTVPTTFYGNPCTTLWEPFISNCNYDYAGHSLAQLYGQLKYRTTAVTANLFTFDQTKYMTGNSLGTIGYIYVPTGCQKGAKCKLHVNFHGCLQTTELIQDIYPVYNGLNEWAESNNIIVLYPQVTNSILPVNPMGCYDWWGYTGPNFANQQGPQLVFVKSLIDAITGR